MAAGGNRGCGRSPEAVSGFLCPKAFQQRITVFRGHLVVHNGRQSGLVTLDGLRKIERKRWPFTMVGQVARRFEQLLTVTPETPLRRALELMAQDNVTELPVVSNGEFGGVVSRGRVVEFMQTQQALKAA